MTDKLLSLHTKRAKSAHHMSATWSLSGMEYKYSNFAALLTPVDSQCFNHPEQIIGVYFPNVFHRSALEGKAAVRL